MISWPQYAFRELMLIADVSRADTAVIVFSLCRQLSEACKPHLCIQVACLQTDSVHCWRIELTVGSLELPWPTCTVAIPILLFYTRTFMVSECFAKGKLAESFCILRHASSFKKFTRDCWHQGQCKVDDAAAEQFP